MGEIIERSFYGLLLGAGYALITLDRHVLPASLLVGLLIGFFSSILDKWFFADWLRRRRFGVVIVIRSLGYLVIIIGVLIFVTASGVAEAYKISWLQALKSGNLDTLLWNKEFITIVLWCFVVLLAVQFVRQVSRLLGRNTLLNYLSGRYYHPKEEERIFMFLDIKSSTSLAEKLGHLKWHRLLNDFFFDISKPISQSKGEIYQYVGDEVVISWSKKKGIKNLNCIRCFFLIMQKIESRRQKYIKKYGTEPEFKAGYHIGKVIAGAIGDYKRSIVYHGDTINTASRIQAESNRLGLRLLLSAQLLQELDLKDAYTTEYIGEIQLRGREEKVELYSLDPL